MSGDAPAPAEVHINGVRLLADLSGALVWPDRRTLVVADLHLEKGSSYANARRLLPPYDSAATLACLRACLVRYRPETVICLGDSFHDSGAGARLGAAEARALQELTGGHRWIWIAGNHDPLPDDGYGGEVAGELVWGALVFRHAALAGPAPGEISGHYHPKAAVRVRGRRLNARCFASDGQRLVMPAFGAYTGGLNVLDPAIQGLFGRGLRAHLLGRSRIVSYRQDALTR